MNERNEKEKHKGKMARQNSRVIIGLSDLARSCYWWGAAALLLASRPLEPPLPKCKLNVNKCLFTKNEGNTTCAPSGYGPMFWTSGQRLVENSCTTDSPFV